MFCFSAIRSIFKYRRAVLVFLIGFVLIGSILIYNQWESLYFRNISNAIKVTRGTLAPLNYSYDRKGPISTRKFQKQFNIAKTLINENQTTHSSWKTALNKKLTGKINVTKLILHYNPPGWMTFSSSDSFGSCEYKNCMFSTDTNDLDKSDAVIFTGTKLPEIPNRKPGQIWIYENIESPVHTSIPSTRWKNVFNWTSTYRRDSDFVAPYRFVVEGISEKYFKLSNIFEIIKKKSNSTAWFVSNCQTSSGREIYVGNLERYMEVDVYGNCGSLMCKREKEEDCRQMLTKKYKFYLAFENSFCHDYITEKALVNLKQIVIPIVRGRAHYDLYMPSHSYINTRNFSSIKNLANYISYVGNDIKLYGQFQKWHNFFHVEEDHMFHDYRVMCKVCKHLHNAEKYQRVYEDIHDWWHGNGDYKKMCNTPEMET